MSSTEENSEMSYDYGRQFYCDGLQASSILRQPREDWGGAGNLFKFPLLVPLRDYSKSFDLFNVAELSM